MQQFEGCLRLYKCNATQIIKQVEKKLEWLFGILKPLFYLCVIHFRKRHKHILP